ncbi:lipoprotein YedD [Type-D symbiont of Plautia stali]|uniref:lipoprotein YedD n=1 Tax=Type-D symbiont of Plautia stali TaxID=1560356 RepID=UPI00073F1F48|nr:lipoprotein YedD [Type-D symbiont of Plautia stali]
MKKWMVLAALALSGCAQITSYEGAVKTPAPQELQGNWQTVGPQSKLISDQAIGSLIIGAQGDTLDCRQWQRVIAKPGKLTRLGDDWVNVTRQVRVMPITLQNGELRYDGLRMRKVDRPTVECQQALEEVAKRPNESVIQNIQPQIMEPVSVPAQK